MPRTKRTTEKVEPKVETEVKTEAVDTVAETQPTDGEVDKVEPKVETEVKTEAVDTVAETQPTEQVTEEVVEPTTVETLYNRLAKFERSLREQNPGLDEETVRDAVDRHRATLEQDPTKPAGRSVGEAVGDATRGVGECCRKVVGFFTLDERRHTVMLGSATGVLVAALAIMAVFLRDNATVDNGGAILTEAAAVADGMTADAPARAAKPESVKPAPPASALNISPTVVAGAMYAAAKVEADEARAEAAEAKAELNRVKAEIAGLKAAAPPAHLVPVQIPRGGKYRLNRATLELFRDGRSVGYLPRDRTRPNGIASGNWYFPHRR